jgi:hypothetical protein
MNSIPVEARAGLATDVPTSRHDVARNRAAILIVLKDLATLFG